MRSNSITLIGRKQDIVKDVSALNINDDDEIEITLKRTGRQWNDYTRKWNG